MLLQAAAALALMPLDHRTILGLDPWIKPFKFSVSIAIFLWTLAWLLPTLRASRRVKSFFSWGFAVCMLVEIVCIAGQSARGVRSHFNLETGFDSAVFGTMGTMIGINSVLLAALLGLFLVRGADLAPSCLWAVRLGLLVTLLGSAQGGLIVAHGQHAVGVADGGEGLPLVNWSTEGGDLRVAHMIGLHGMQIVPLFAFLLGRLKPRWTERRRIGWVVGFSTIYAAAGGVLLVHALSGQPVFPQRLGGLREIGQRHGSQQTSRVPVASDARVPGTRAAHSLQYFWQLTRTGRQCRSRRRPGRRALGSTFVGVGVGVRVAVRDGPAVAVRVRVGVAVRVAVRDGAAVEVRVAVRDGPAVGVRVAVCDGPAVGAFGVRVGVAVHDAIGVGVRVGVGVAFQLGVRFGGGVRVFLFCGGCGGLPFLSISSLPTSPSLALVSTEATSDRLKDRAAALPKVRSTRVTLP